MNFKIIENLSFIHAQFLFSASIYVSIDKQNRLYVLHMERQ